MKLDKNKTKSILITSILIVFFSSIFIYFQKESITVIEDDLNSSQEIQEKSCSKFSEIKKEFEPFLSPDPLAKNYTDRRINLKLSENSPIESYTSLDLFENELSLKNQKELINFFNKNIEPKLKKLGFVKSSSYSVFNNEIFQYTLNNYYYTISIPTNKESAVVSSRLELNCGIVNDNFSKLYSLVRNKYNENYSISIWEFSSKVLVLNVTKLNSISGTYNVYDISNNKPVLIYEGQEQVKCSLLKEKNINFGISCSDD